MIVKDNFQTIGLQTAAGNLALKGYTPSKDAFQVKRIKQAGAIVLAKSNMAEFAFSPLETVNSLLPGYTRNPYALDRVTAGSSGGTAAAVAADLGEVGLGHGHRQLDSRTERAQRARRDSLDDGAGEPRRDRAAEPLRRHRRPDGAHGGRRRRGASRSSPATTPTIRPPSREGQADSRLLGVTRARRSQGRAHRRAASGVRAPDRRSRGRAVFNRRSRICAAPARRCSTR